MGSKPFHLSVYPFFPSVNVLELKKVYSFRGVPLWRLPTSELENYNEKTHPLS